MIVRKNNKVVVLGITGRQGTFWTDKMLEAGENQQERNARRRNG